MEAAEGRWVMAMKAHSALRMEIFGVKTVLDKPYPVALIVPISLETATVSVTEMAE